MDESKWIPVENRLPEKDGEYLVTRYDDVCFMFVADYEKQNNSWRYFDDVEQTVYEVDDVIAWMSLPEPYNP